MAGPYIQPIIMSLNSVKQTSKLFFIKPVDGYAVGNINDSYIQSIAVIKELKLDQEVVNVNGGAIALDNQLERVEPELVILLRWR